MKQAPEERKRKRARPLEINAARLLASIEAMRGKESMENRQ